MTPRTDAAEFDWTATCRGEAPCKPALVIDAAIARELERDNARLRDALAKIMRAVKTHPFTDPGRGWGDFEKQARELQDDITNLRIAYDALQLNLEMTDDELRRTVATMNELRLALTNIHALSSVPLAEASRHALEGIIVRIDDYAHFALEKGKASVTMQEIAIRGECAP